MATDDSLQLASLAAEARHGRRDSFVRLLADHRPRLRRIVAFRLDPRLAGRVDPSDVLQEAFLEASQRLDDYLRSPVMPPFVWLRFLSMQWVARLHRQHLGAQARAAHRDAPLPDEAHDETSARVAEQLAAALTSPSDAAVKAERWARLREALRRLDPVDLEVLALRHFEELTHTEIAATLGLTRGGASQRYQRALARLRELLVSMYGSVEAL